MKNNFGKIFSGILLALVIAGGIFAVIFKQRIIDFVKASNFSPSSEMSGLISDISLTGEAEITLKSTSPLLLEAEEFNQNCKNRLEDTSVLGCYRGDNIFVFDIDNPELDGIKHTTLAHEMLHAVWARLDSAEKNRLGKILDAEYERLKTPKFEELMKRYAISQPGEHQNELHSILGTEFAELSPELEEYYARYFNNRQAVVGFYKKYHGKFEELETKSAQLQSEITSLKKEIEAEQQDYSAKIKLLNDQIADFNSRAENGDFSSQREFNFERQNLLSKSQFLNEYRAQINSKVDDFNLKVGEFNSISTQTQKLFDAMNSTLPEASSGL